MQLRTSGRRRSIIAVLFLGMVCFLPAGRANAESGPLPAPTPQQLLRRAEQAERQTEWSKAAELYGQVLAKDRGLADVRQHYLWCSRRAQQVRRHRDAAYRQHIADLSLRQALQIYGEVLNKLQLNYVDADKADVASLFRQGQEEFHLALDDEPFCREQAPETSLGVIRAFQTQILMELGNPAVSRIADAQEVVRGIAQESSDRLGIKPVAVVLEFICGACAGLDEHTSYLTPAQLREISASWKGKAISVGLELAADEKGVIVAQVAPGSSADVRGIKAGDRLTRVGDKTATRGRADIVADWLRGEAETTVVVEILLAGESSPRSFELKRQVVQVPSISEPRFVDERLGIGYLQIYGFQETTVQELDAAIAQMQGAGMKVLILDLRGNEGGLFKIGIQVAERFVSAGLIASTHGQGPLREYNKYYYARGMNVFALPVVVLVDGETASSAEIVAGAVKEHQRGTLVGQTTFGKGCMQEVFKLNSTPAGLRLTVAKFYSPRGHAYTPNGVTPDLAVARAETPMDVEQDAQLQAAVEAARPLAMGR